MLKIVENHDVELRDLAEEELKEMKEKYGKRYCPCALERNEDTICICKEFINQDTPGACHCGRWEKVEC